MRRRQVASDCDVAGVRFGLSLMRTARLDKGMDPILQSHLPFAPFADPRTRKLPGIVPMDPADWLRGDDAYAGQMALRDRLIAERPEAVHALLPQGRAAAGELYDKVLAEELPRLGFRLTATHATRPDGVTVPLDSARPLLTLGRLVQEDLCLMEAGPDGEHVMTGAILCFPAGWTLAEKIGRPLMRIHAPVPRYDPDVGRRVQRLFDAIRPGQPLWRANAHLSRAPLFNPRAEDAEKADAGQDLPFLRSERQGLVRLARTGAVASAIHTYLVRVGDLTPDQQAALAEHPIHASL